MYNYKEALREDVLTWIDEHHEAGASKELEFDYDRIFDGCWDADEVTGNGSGSYTFNRARARENFFEDDNSEDYLYRMVNEGFASYDELGLNMATGDWEWVDVCIRCYLLSEVVREIIDEIDF